ncbi:MAG: substrate-binding domain-containing protein [Pseudomonadota bacterium]
MITRRQFSFLVTMASLAMAARARAEDNIVILGATTTTDASGLHDWLLPQFEADTGIAARVVVAGTGRILQLARAGDIDLALTHDPIGEAEFGRQNPGTKRCDVMRNDFLIVGPFFDPAAIRGYLRPDEALQRISDTRSLFFSRGDDSGTHRREMALWNGSIAPGDWYRETGAGMGATLNIAASSDGYTLVDRGTWAAFGNRGALTELVEGSPDLANQYAALLPRAGDRPSPNRPAAERLFSWLTSARGQTAIELFRIRGKQVFFPNAAC